VSHILAGSMMPDIKDCYRIEFGAIAYYGECGSGVGSRGILCLGRKSWAIYWFVLGCFEGLRRIICQLWNYLGYDKLANSIFLLSLQLPAMSDNFLPGYFLLTSRSQGIFQVIGRTSPVDIILQSSSECLN